MQTLSDAATSDLCASFQAVAFQHVEDRLKHALNYVERQLLGMTHIDQMSPHRRESVRTREVLNRNKYSHVLMNNM